jgi:hypothetical protein
MRKRSEIDYNAFHIILGLLIGFLLGSSVIYWHTSRQSDRMMEEIYNKVVVMFMEQNTRVQPKQPSVSTAAATPPAPAPIKVTTAPEDVNDNQNYQLAKDKLLNTRVFTLKIAPESDNDRRLDSLLGNTSTPPSKQQLFVEFWESPLNTVGYKMGKNKIMLYGIRSADFADIIRIRGKIYLRYLNEYYPLELTSSFKPLVPVNESFFSQQTESF